MQAAKAAVESFEAGPPPIDPSFVADPLNPNLMESNAVLSEEKERLTAEMMAHVVKDGVAPMDIINVMRLLTVKLTMLEGEMAAGLDPQEYADRLQMAAERDDKIVEALREAGRGEDADKVAERAVTTRKEHAGVLEHILSQKGGGGAGGPDEGDDDGLDELDELSDEDAGVDIQARIGEFDADIAKHKQDAQRLKKAGDMDPARVAFRRMKQVQQNKETFLVGAGAAGALQEVVAQVQVDPASVKRKFEEAMKGAETAHAAGDEPAKAKYMKEARIYQAQLKEANAAKKAAQPAASAAPAPGPPPLSQVQQQAYQKLMDQVTKQAQCARDQAGVFKLDKQAAGYKEAMVNYQADLQATKLIKACKYTSNPQRLPPGCP